MLTEQASQRFKMVFFAFFFSSLMYLIIGVILSRNPFEPRIGDSVQKVLLGIFLVVSFLILMKVNSMKNQLRELKLEEESVFRRALMLFALSEVPVILGLVYFFLTGMLSWLLVFWGISCICFVLAKSIAKA